MVPNGPPHGWDAWADNRPHQDWHGVPQDNRDVFCAAWPQKCENGGHAEGSLPQIDGNLSVLACCEKRQLEIKRQL